MAVPYRKNLRMNPQDKNATGKYYPQIVTQGISVGLDYVADIMQRFSSLSQGDIKSVLDNLGEAMKIALATGVSINIADFGIFSLSAKTEGRETKKECNSKCIKAVNIRFRSSASVKMMLTGTRGATKLQFYSIDDDVYEEVDDPNGPGGNGGEDVDPNA